MNAQTTIKVRRVNNNPVTTGKHMTLMTVFNMPSENRVFAYATTDDGEEVFIPSKIVQNEQMTEADVGAGLTIRTRNNPRALSESNIAPLIAIPPLTWDGEAEEVTIDVPEEEVPGTNQDVTELEMEFAKLAEGCDDMAIASSKELDTALNHMSNMEFRDAIRIVKATRDKLEAFRAWIDEMAPEND